jgi:hypothetical protein
MNDAETLQLSQQDLNREAPHPEPENWHPDDAAVDAFATALKAKLAASRAKGRGGWDDPHFCTNEDLSIMLRVHVGKGDPVDVANFCMMLWNRHSAILKAVAPVNGSIESIKAAIDAAIERDRERSLQMERGRRDPERSGGRRFED